MMLELEYFFLCSEQDTQSLSPAGGQGRRRGDQGGAACRPLTTTRRGADARSGGQPLLAGPGAPSVLRRDPQLREVKAQLCPGLPWSRCRRLSLPTAEAPGPPAWGGIWSRPCPNSKSCQRPSPCPSWGSWLSRACVTGGGSELGAGGLARPHPLGADTWHSAQQEPQPPGGSGSGGREEHRESILMLPELFVRPLPLLAAGGGLLCGQSLGAGPEHLLVGSGPRASSGGPG